METPVAIPALTGSLKLRKKARKYTGRVYLYHKFNKEQEKQYPVKKEGNAYISTST